MLLKITEINAWEGERWSYVLDLEKQQAAAINDLMLFIPLANKLYDEVKENTPISDFAKGLAIFGPPRKIFAASKYSFGFYDKLEGMTLVSKGHRLQLGTGGSYKGNFLDLNQKISVKKMKAALIAIRDKSTNKLYKSFEDIFEYKKLKSGVYTYK